MTRIDLSEDDRSIPGRLQAAAAAFLLIWAVTGVPTGLAAPTTLTLAPGQADVRFGVDYLGFTRVTGWLDQVSGVVVTDLVAGAGQIDLIVDAKSVNTGSELRDALVRSAMLFDVAHHPLIRFHSTAVTFEHHDVVGVAGMLTLHGVTQPVVWHVGPSRCSELHSLGPADCSLSATLTVHRSDFGMRYALPFVGDDVDLEFNLHWSRPAPTNGPAEGEGDR